jgi:hypothetical protein
MCFCFECMVCFLFKRITVEVRKRSDKGLSVTVESCVDLFSWLIETKITLCLVDQLTGAFTVKKGT